MTSLTEQQHALIWHKYMDLLKENQEKDLMILEKDEIISRLRRELVKANIKVRRLEQMMSPELFLRTPN
jgi:hypothetical protein